MESTFHVGKYTSPIDGMDKLFFQELGVAVISYMVWRKLIRNDLKWLFEVLSRLVILESQHG